MMRPCAVFVLMTMAALTGRNALAAIDDQITIGNTRVVVRTVIGSFEGDIRTLALEDDVYHNELIETEEESATKMIFLDETTLTLGPESSVVLDSFVFDPDPSKASLVMRATKGIFRFASGKLPKNAYRLHTPAATIGIRGTVLDFAIEPPDHAGGQAVVKIALREGEATIGSCRGEQLARSRPVGRAALEPGQALQRPLRRRCAEPAQVLHLRPGRRELGLAHRAGEIGARLNRALVLQRRVDGPFGRQTEPGIGEDVVLRHAAAVPVHQAEVGLRRNLALLRRLPIPAGGGCIIVGNALAPLVQQAHVVLGIGQAPAGRSLMPRRRQLWVARHPPAQWHKGCRDCSARPGGPVGRPP
jgi:FecR protein